MKKVLFLLPALLLSCNPTTQAGHICASNLCYSNSYVQQQVVYRDRYIYTPQIQQYVAIPVQPYYASWNALYGTVPSTAAITQQAPVQAAQQMQQQLQQRQNQVAPATTATDPRFESPYLTREEFLAAMQDITAALREGGGSSGAVMAPGVPPKIAGLVRNKCATCHSAETPSGKWVDTGEPVVLWDRDRLADKINWDRIAIVTLTGKMPKEGKLTQQEINDFVHHAANFKQKGAARNGNGNGNPPPAPQPNGNGGQPPNPDVNY